MRSTSLSLAIGLTLAIGLAGCSQKSSPLQDGVVKKEDDRAQGEVQAQLAEARADKEKSASGKDAAIRDEIVAVRPVTHPEPGTPPPPAMSLPKPATELAAQPLESRKAIDNYSGLMRHRAVRSTTPADAKAGAPAFTNAAPMVTAPPATPEPANTERYQDHADNPLQIAADNPVSTFSIDVDTGSYTNVRRMLNANQLPPSDAVRAEEFLNYFDYGYVPPARRDVPFSVTTELAAAPWNAGRKLLLVGIKGYEVPRGDIPPSNLVFLIDTSGSMNSSDKLPLLRDAFKQLVPNLREQDRVSIVVYAGSAGLVLPPTPGNQHQRILEALDGLSAGGSTNGGAGIQLAYAMAKQSLIKGGVNRVVLATDGDFNVGTTDDTALKTLVENERKNGVALTTLGFGAGNYNEQLAEQLADIGNGNHAYIDTLAEARKVLVAEAGSTLFTIAKDVKIQVEFNPAVVAEYRLIGYENRALRREDFNNDNVDAGEIGAGHDVTALYELSLVGDGSGQVDPLRYGGGDKPANSVGAAEIAFVKLRYKQPDEDNSRLIERPVRKSELRDSASENLRFAAAVAAFADSLRGGSHLGKFDLGQVAALARNARGKDADGYRAEFIKLVETAQRLKGDEKAQAVAVIAD
ncbi:Ca-activated chloride channel family protein [Tahibacter aquaticus]|uniref:Ca-activated chloride channel family protein n=1 Tax=Tahibacter aquaticus TaxID=520092 RepID=A0A4R6YSC9_9GAMM|nr:VWA domain-containing protein [Tahibacter aquaticus]TDR41151.1 Ca-activated chloride channel family protein [Tahibacter aquaticus]